MLRLKRLWSALRDCDARFSFWMNRQEWRLGQIFTVSQDWSARLCDRKWLDLGAKACAFGVNAGFAVLVVALMMTQALDPLVKDNWQQADDYAVRFFDRYGRELGQRGQLYASNLAFEDYPTYLVQAVLATEDRRFYRHFGVDVIGTVRALFRNISAGGVVEGGSTITQQVAKNIFLTHERTLSRKVKEAFLALWLEGHFSKANILRFYFSRSYLGGGAVGLGAAAEFYFQKNVRDLSFEESLLLAGLFKAPSQYAPHVNLPRARARAREVLGNLHETGVISDADYAFYLNRPLPEPPQGTSHAPDYFLDWAYDEIRKRDLGGARILSVTTTLDLDLQRAAELAVETAFRQSQDQFRFRQGALVSLNHLGQIVAMVGGRDYGSSQFNRATQALRQPGSSFKPFVYTAAIQSGLTPDTIVRDQPLTLGRWSPKNYNRSYRGAVTLREALARSINTIPVRLALQVGYTHVVDLAHRMGIDTPITRTGPMPLGVSEVTVLDMAEAYNCFPSGGICVTPQTFLRIQALDTLETRLVTPHRQRIFSEDVAKTMNAMLHEVTVNGTARRALIDGLPVAGKTGTTQDYRDAWFIGYSGNYTTAVWFGNDDFSPTARLTGGSVPAETWARYMRFAHGGADIRKISGLDALYTSDPSRGLSDQNIISDLNDQGGAAQSEHGDGMPFSSGLKRFPLTRELNQILSDVIVSP